MKTCAELLLGGCLATAGSGTATMTRPRWVQDTFGDFSAGTLDAAGADLFITHRSSIRTTHRFDLNGDGHIDLVFNSSHDDRRAILPTCVKFPAGQRHPRTLSLPTYGTSAVVIADLNRDGLPEAITLPNDNGTTKRRLLSIFYMQASPALVTSIAAFALSFSVADAATPVPFVVVAAADASLPDRHGVTLPQIDLTGEANAADYGRHVVLAQGTEASNWQHPSLLLMPDGHTMFATWTLGHGGTCGPMKRSDDAGRTWSDPLPVPSDWASYKNCPSLHRLVDSRGVARLVVFALDDSSRSFVRSMSEDSGRTWSPMAPAGFRGVVPPLAVLTVEGGRKLRTWTHEGGKIQNVLQCDSTDGGLTWGPQTEPIDKRLFPESFPCEPEVIRSPDGRQLLMLMRENNRRYNSLWSVSNDEGRTWSRPAELPAALTGDRHTAAFAPDGRLLVMFRDRRPVPKSEANHEKGGWPVWGSERTTIWVGRYDDIPLGREGHYLLRVLGYGGYGKLQRMPDGSMLGITYCRYPYGGPAASSIVTTRFTLAETDTLAASGRQRFNPAVAHRPLNAAREEDAQAKKETSRQ